MFALTFFLFLLLALPCVYSMVGMGFNNLDNWPSVGLQSGTIRIWDIGVSWRDTHLAVDLYDWSKLDILVAQIESVGANAIYVIGACPQWLAKYPDQPNYAPWLGPGSNSMPYDINEFNKWVWNLSTRYNGRIAAYEVWNEPQLSDFLYPYNAEECNDLANMTKRAYSTIKTCDAAATVLAASILPRSSSGGMSKASKYLDSMEAFGWNVDGYTCHIYPYIDEGAESWHDMLVDTKDTLAGYNAPNAANLWVTETNYNLLGPVVSEEVAPVLTSDTYMYASNEGISVVVWYGWDTTGSLGGLDIREGTSAWNEIATH